MVWAAGAEVSRRREVQPGWGLQIPPWASCRERMEPALTEPTVQVLGRRGRVKYVSVRREGTLKKDHLGPGKQKREGWGV